ncbi:hypothetical protein QAD02_003177 [Eretmocerus hayati]|uniref:Uncharacterized protein n=1 Tax=Eretmocerus hayati TaxID=131215 RepID=A0ACC2NL40_9HYME|nr:hypothetical protein QAD02_003177 [Eretmocerus hayati]
MCIVLQDVIFDHELARADVMFNAFAERVEYYIDLGAAKYNLQLSKHVCQNVRNWGPVWAISAFGPETYNHYKVKAIKSANGVPQQIARQVTFRNTETVLEEHLYPRANELVKFFCLDALSAKCQHILKILGLTYLKLPKPLPACDVTRNLGLSPLSVKFTRLVKDGCLYSSDSNVQSIDNYALLRDSRVMKIIYSIVDEINRRQFTLRNEVITRSAFQGLQSKMHLVHRVMSGMIIVGTNEIERVCVQHMEAYKKEYIGPVPNLLHY